MARNWPLSPTLSLYLLTGATLAPCAPQLAAQGRAPDLIGGIRDARTGEPISGAEVILGEGLVRVSTDQDGQFQMTGIAEGVYTIHVVRMGYEDLERDGVQVGPTAAPIQLELSTAVVSLSEIVVAPGAYSFLGSSGGPQDQRHARNLDLTYRWSQAWSVNGSYAFHTGWPGTLESLRTVTDESGNPDVAILPDVVCGTRLPNYHRLDARLTRRTSFRGGDLRVFVEISNLTNRENVFGYDYFRSPGPGGGIVLSRDVETGFTILPSVGVSWAGNL